MINEPSVMASAPGGTGPPTHIRLTVPTRPSKQARGEGLAVAGDAGVIRAQRLEDVDELLAGLVVALHPVEQAVEPGLDLGAGTLGRTTQPGQGRHPAHLWRLGDAGQEGESTIVVA